MQRKITAVNFAAFFTALFLIMRIAVIDNDTKVLEAASDRGRYVLSDKC